MKKLLALLFLTIFFCINADARAKYASYSQRGGKDVKTSATVTYELMETFPLSTITVYIAGTTTLATIYSNSGGSVLANPFTADTNAYFEFYANNGKYDIKFSGTGITVPFTRGDIGIADFNDYFDPKGFGGCAGTNDTAVFSSMMTLIGAVNPATIHLPYNSGVKCAVNNLTITSNITINAQDSAGLTINSGQTLTHNGYFIAPFRQIFFGAGKVILSTVNNPIYKTAWWGNKVVTVSGPVLAPTLTSAVVTDGTAFTNATVYLICYTYEVWNGETGCSPTATFTAKNGQLIAGMPKAEAANNSKYAVGAYFYASPDAGLNWYRLNGAFAKPGIISFGDDTAGWGGAVLHWENGTSGISPPAGGTTATTKSGIVVSPPTLAPTVNPLAAITAATYFGAYNYNCEDGTQTALSPISAGVVMAGSAFIRFEREEEPPSGAVSVNLYVGTVASSSQLHFQKTVPLHYVTSDIHDYNIIGIAPSAGVAQSTLSNFQQAYDSMMDSGKAGKILVSGIETKVPLIIRLINTSGAIVTGFDIEGLGSYENMFTSVTTGQKLSYTGAQSDSVVGIMVSTSNLKWTGLSLGDPNSRLSIGLAACDFQGGGGFTSVWHKSTFAARKSGSIGFQIPVQSAGAGTHTTSEQHFYDCNFSGDAWGVDVHGGQTTDIQLVNCATLSNGNSGSANSGQIRNANSLSLDIRGWEGSGTVDGIGYVFFITTDVGHPLSGGTGMSISNVLMDAIAGAATSFIHVSGLALSAGGTISVSDSVFNSSYADRYAYYSAGQINLLLNNVRGGGNGWSNWINKTPTEVDRVVIQQNGKDSFFELGATYGFKISSNVTNSISDNADKTKVYIDNVLLSRTGTNSATPATITTNVDDYDPENITKLLRLSSDASRNITGLTHSFFAVLEGKEHLIINIGSFDIVLKHQDIGSAAAWRFLNSTGADITLTPNQSADLIYDSAISRWRVSKRN